MPLGKSPQEKRVAEHKETLEDLQKVIDKAKKQISDDQAWIAKAKAEIRKRWENIDANHRTLYTTEGEMKTIEKWLAK